MVLKSETPISVPILVLKSLKKRFFKVQFPKMYTQKNYINCYNFCQ